MDGSFRTDGLTAVGSPDPWAAKHEAPDDAASRLSVLNIRTLADVAADVDNRAPRRFLFEGVMVAGDYGVLSAEDKAGKTWSGLDAAVSCAAGVPWLGRFACQTSGPVLVFLGEGSDAKMLRRIRAIGEHKGLTRKQTDQLPIRMCFRVPFLSDIGHLAQIDDHLDHHPAALVILDPLYLAAKGGKGSDLFAMGELLGNVQRIVQPRGASLLVLHHWNKTGEGSGHNRSSGVGPGAWGRFLISIAVKANDADPVTGMTTVRTEWAVRGDEIADAKVAFVRKVWTDDPKDLNSPMHYSVGADQLAMSDVRGASDVRLSPADRKIIWALKQDTAPAAIKVIVDRVKEKYGHGLARETVSTALNKMLDLGMVDRLSGEHGGAALWSVISDLEV